MTITRKEIEQVFELWNKEYLVNPDKFDDIKEWDHVKQTRYFLKLLKIIRSKSLVNNIRLWLQRMRVD